MAQTKCDCNTETTLRCGKCDKPLCPKCLVETPVGARCRECARMRKLPTFQVSPRNYLVALGTGLGLAIGLGIAWGAVGWALRLFLHVNLNLILSPAVGYTMGEVISLSVNRRRGRGLAALAGFSMAMSYLAAVLFPWGLGYPSNPMFLILDLIAIALGILLAVNRLR